MIGGFSGAALLGCALAIAAPAASSKPPDCASRLAKNTVLKLANDHAPLPERFSYVIDEVKTVDAKENASSCTADLMRVYKEEYVYRSSTIRYTVTRKADGSLYVSIENLPSR